jgi:hypothetical protein
MEHRIEVAPSGRATCKTCGKTIAKGELRLGEEYASQFGDGVAVRWHHLPCAATKLPEVLKPALASYAGEVPNRAELEATMSGGGAGAIASEAAPKKKQGTGGLPGADLAPTGRAKCIHCGEAIAKGTVRVAVEREIDTGSFTTKGAGYLHPACCEAWVEKEWPAGLADLVMRVNESTSLDALPPPFGDSTGAPVAGAPKEKKAKAPKAAKVDGAAADAAPAKAEVPGFGALSGKQVVSIADKLGKLRESWKADSVLDKANVDWGQRDGLRWHLARHGLLPATHPTLLDRLGESAANASADDVFAVLPTLDRPTKDVLPLVPGWTLAADKLALRAYELDSARLEAMLEGASPTLRVGIQLVRGRHGASVPETDRAAVLRALAEAEASQYGISRSFGANGSRLVLARSEGGQRTEPFTTALDLARCFGTDEAWLEALTDAARAGAFQSLEHVSAALVRLPLADLVPALAKNFQSSNAAHDKAVQAVLDRRSDPPEALLAAALTLPKDAYPASYLRKFLVPAALAKMTEAPPGAEAEVAWDDITHVCSPPRGYDVGRANAYGAMRAIGRERALGLARERIARGYNRFQALPFLAVHWDEGLCRDAIAQLDDHADVNLFAPLGARVLPMLLEGMASEPPQGVTKEKRLVSLRRAVMAVLAAEGQAGRTTDAAYDAYVSCEPGESYWSEDHRNALPRALAAMTDARRMATLDRLFAETKWPERPFYGVHTVTDASYLEKAARTLVKRYGQVNDRHALQLGLKALPPGALAAFRPALLEEKPDPKLFEELKYVFGHAEVDRVMKEGGVVEEKPFDRLFRLAKEALAAGGAKTRMYLLERSDFGDEVPAPRPGSFSRARGAGPAIDRAATELGEREHILTIDLEEVPELARPGVRALSLYASDPEHGDAWDAARLVEVPAGTPAPSDGTPLSVVPIEVPFAIFDEAAKRDDPRTKEIGGLVFNRPGYVLGEPMFIQEPEDGGTFVMQLAERVADLNLGDSGSLYVFESGSFMQCY